MHQGSDDDASADRRVQLDNNLKRAFDETAQEPLPDQFVELLEKLRQRKG